MNINSTGAPAPTAGAAKGRNLFEQVKIWGKIKGRR